MYPKRRIRPKAADMPGAWPPVLADEAATLRSRLMPQTTMVGAGVSGRWYGGGMSRDEYQARKATSTANVAARREASAA